MHRVNIIKDPPRETMLVRQRAGGSPARAGLNAPKRCDPCGVVRGTVKWRGCHLVIDELWGVPHVLPLRSRTLKLGEPLHFAVLLLTGGLRFSLNRICWMNPACLRASRGRGRIRYIKELCQHLPACQVTYASDQTTRAHRRTPSAWSPIGVSGSPCTSCRP